MFKSEISDHHLMIYTMIKSVHTQLEPKVFRKWQNKNFSKESSLKDLKPGFSNDGVFNHFNNEFQENFRSTCSYKTDKTLWNHNSSCQ